MQRMPSPLFPGGENKGEGEREKERKKKDACVYGKLSLEIPALEEVPGQAVASLGVAAALICLCIISPV